MSESTLNRILEDLDSLEPQELEQIGHAVEARIRSEADAKRRAFHNALLAAGLVRQIKSRRPGETIDRSRIIAVGRPISETLIEERR